MCVCTHKMYGRLCGKITESTYSLQIRLKALRRLQ